MMIDSARRIYDTALSVRARNALIGRGICTVDDLAACTGNQLLGIKNVGERTVAEIAGFLSKHGLSLRQPNVSTATGWHEEVQRMIDHAVTPLHRRLCELEEENSYKLEAALAARRPRSK